MYRFLKSKDYSVAISPVDMFRHDLSMAVYKYERECGHHICDLSAVLQVSYDTTTISFELMSEPTNWELVVTLTMDLREAGYIPALPINSVAYELEI